MSAAEAFSWGARLDLVEASMMLAEEHAEMVAFRPWRQDYFLARVYKLLRYL